MKTKEVLDTVIKKAKKKTEILKPEKIRETVSARIDKNLAKLKRDVGQKIAEKKSRFGRLELIIDNLEKYTKEKNGVWAKIALAGLSIISFFSFIKNTSVGRFFGLSDKKKEDEETVKEDEAKEDEETVEDKKTKEEYEKIKEKITLLEKDKKEKIDWILRNLNVTEKEAKIIAKNPFTADAGRILGTKAIPVIKDGVPYLVKNVKEGIIEGGKKVAYGLATSGAYIAMEYYKDMSDLFANDDKGKRIANWIRKNAKGTETEKQGYKVADFIGDYIDPTANYLLSSVSYGVVFTGAAAYNVFVKGKGVGKSALGVILKSLGWPVSIPFYITKKGGGMIKGVYKGGKWTTETYKKAKEVVSRVPEKDKNIVEKYKKKLTKIEQEIKKQDDLAKKKMKEISELKKTNPEKAKKMAAEFDKKTQKNINGINRKLKKMLGNTNLEKCDKATKKRLQKMIKESCKKSMNTKFYRLIKSAKGKSLFVGVALAITMFGGREKISEKLENGELLKLLKEFGPETLQLLLHIMAPFGVTDFYSAISGETMLTGKKLSFGDRVGHALWGVAGVAGDTLAIVTGGTSSVIMRSIKAGLKGAGKSDKIAKAMKAIPKITELAGKMGWKNLVKTVSSPKAIKALKTTKYSGYGLAIGHTVYETDLISYLGQKLIYTGPDIGTKGF